MSAITHPVYSFEGWIGRNFYSQNPLRSPDGQFFDIPSNMNPTDRTLLAWGRYEHTDIKLIRRYFQPDTTIIELGGNIGVVGRYAFTEKLEKGGTYICVEPNPDSYEALRLNMQRAQSLCPNRHLEIIRAAISDPSNEGKSADFFVRKNLSSGLKGQVVDGGREVTTRVGTTSLSQLIRNYAPDGASLICDIEGGEIPLMYKDRAAFAHIRQIVIELHQPSLTGSPVSPRDMVAQLNKLGFAARKRIGSSYYFKQDAKRNSVPSLPEMDLG